MFNSEKDELKRDNCVDYNEFMNSGCNSGNFFNDATPDETVLIGHTSGTTGKPKGAKISHFSLANQDKFGGMRSGLGSGHHRILCNVPLFHAFGYVGALAIPSVWGITSLFPAPGFDVNASLAATLNNSPTSFFGTPTMFVDFFRGLDKMEKEGKFNMSDSSGVMDKNGYLSIVGRSKDMIIRGGENIYPAEIEDVLREHGQIADAQVVGRPDERLGEEVAVYVRVGAGCFQP